MSKLQLVRGEAPQTTPAPQTLDERVAKIRAFVDAQRVRKDRKPGWFKEVETELHKQLGEIQRDLTAEIIAAHDVDAPVIEVAGKLHRRVPRAAQTYMTAAGPVTVERWLYRERDDDSQPSISPVERRLGIIDFWTPKAAKQALWAVAQMTPQKAAEAFEKLGSMEPSKSSLDRLPKKLSEVWEASREDHEAALRDALALERLRNGLVPLTGFCQEVQVLSRRVDRSLAPRRESCWRILVLADRDGGSQTASPPGSGRLADRYHRAGDARAAMVSGATLEAQRACSLTASPAAVDDRGVIGPRRTLDSSTIRRPAPRSEPDAELVPALTIAAHPDAARIGDRLVLHDVATGGDVLLARSAPEFCRPGSVLGSPLADPYLSRRPIRISLGSERRIRLASEGGTVLAINGAECSDVEVGPLMPGVGVPIELAERIVLVLHLVEGCTSELGDSPGMVGQGLGIVRLRRALQRVADLEVSVLLRGETGTGKELVARALHDRSARSRGPFVSVNLGAVSKELAAAELFGAVRGAYTGATRDREGYFRTARGGTLFLDELGEASPEVQAMLLRVLETGELYPVGGDTAVKTDVRVIAATDADLDAQIRDGRFKAPLLHRLASHELHLPPLRERAEDVGILFHHFARQELAAIGEPERLAAPDPQADPWLPTTIARRLVGCRWPGNIRQLRNVTRQLVIASRGQPQLQIEPRLAAELIADAMPVYVASPPSTPQSLRRRPADVTDAELIAALRATTWDLKAAADRLGIPRPSIYTVIDRSPSVRTAGALSAAEIERCHRECAGDLDRMVERLEVSRRALRRRLKELGLDVIKG